MSGSSRRAKHVSPDLATLQSRPFEQFIRDFVLSPTFEKESDGLCKVTLPHGWWSESGISFDRTGRGPSWEAGTPLGELQINPPIRQCCSAAPTSMHAFDFTMVELKPVSLAMFREQADRHKERQQQQQQQRGGGGGAPTPSSLGDAAGPDDDTLADEQARHFWRSLGPTMEPAVYGADKVGSLFNEESASGWNVDRLDTCLQLLLSDGVGSSSSSSSSSSGGGGGDTGKADEPLTLPGVTNAYLYVGMWGSVFAAHTEDCDLLSLNVLHAGEPKYWYSIAPKDSRRFESLAASYFPSSSRSCADFLRHKKYLLSPDVLRKAGIAYTTCVQRPGDAVVTFPGAYHFGFNVGFNVAESANFATPDWIPRGRGATACLCVPHSVRINMGRFEDLLGEFRNERGDRQDGYKAWATDRCEARRRTVEGENGGDHPPDGKECGNGGIMGGGGCKSRQD